MADITQIRVGSNLYNIQDAQMRTDGEKRLKILGDGSSHTATLKNSSGTTTGTEYRSHYVYLRRASITTLMIVGNYATFGAAAASAVVIGHDHYARATSSTTGDYPENYDSCGRTYYGGTSSPPAYAPTEIYFFKNTDTNYEYRYRWTLQSNVARTMRHAQSVKFITTASTATRTEGDAATNGRILSTGVLTE